MSQYPSVRAPSNGDRPAQHLPSTGHSRMTTNVDDAKRQSLTAFGNNASDRKGGGREPFTVPNGSANRPQRSQEPARPHIQDRVSTRLTSSQGYSGSWAPRASLMPASTAPLATRISLPPLFSAAPSSLHPRHLSYLSLQEQEHAIIDDLLFVFMGFEGQYITFMETYHPLEEKERLVGPSFRISPGLDPSLRDLTTSMLKMASQYTALEAFMDVQSREEFGMVNHALCGAIRKLLKDYLSLVAQLEHQVLTNEGFTFNLLSLHTKSTTHMIQQLYNIGQEILRKNSILEEDSNDSDDMDDVDDIIENLREGRDGDAVAAKKVCKGGSVLGLITKRLTSMSGDPAAKTLLTTLLRDASRPYMKMLNEWLHHGGINDPHSEFLIKEQQSIKREGLEQDYTDEYWEKRYTIRENDVPPQLESVKDKVLLAGKYLNVVRECGGVDISAEVKDVPTSFDDARFLDNVNNAYSNANTSLLTLLLTTHALPARLRSLKHYFFLDRSDFFSYFLELGNSELNKPAKNVNTAKLQSLLEIVLRQPGSVAAEDPYKEDVKVLMHESSLTTWLMRVVNVTGLDQDASGANMSTLLAPAAAAAATTSAEDRDIKGFDALVLDYSVPFPLSLMISRVTKVRYQLLFRHLLSLRHLETLLVNSWTEHNKTLVWKHRSADRRLEHWKRRAWTLRARMLCFVQQMLYYCTAEVIEPNWQALMVRINQQDDQGDTQPQNTKRTVDELMQDHVNFLATCLKECMLTDSKLLRVNAKVMNGCMMFANYTSSLGRYLAAADVQLTAKQKESGAHAKESKASSMDPGTAAERLADLIPKYEDYFSKHLKILLDCLNYYAATETVVFLSLCARLSTASEGLPGMITPSYD